MMSEGHLGDERREVGLDGKTFCLIVTARRGAAKATRAVILSNSPNRQDCGANCALNPWAARNAMTSSVVSWGSGWEVVGIAAILASSSASLAVMFWRAGGLVPSSLATFDFLKLQLRSRWY